MRHRSTFLVLLILSLVPSIARAHGTLRRSRPAAGATLHEVPRLLRLEFNEAPELAVSSVRLLDARRREIALSPLRTPGDSLRVVIADVAGQLAAGRYTVQWQIAGRDGHPVRGQFDFTIAADAAGLAPALPVPVVERPGLAPTAGPAMPRAPAPATFDAESGIYVAIRWAQYVGLLVVIGAVAFRRLVLGAVGREAPDSPAVADAASRAHRLATLGALLLAASSIARLLAQWTAVRLAAITPSAMPLERVVWQTTWGHAWLLQAAALAVLAGGLVLARRGAARDAGGAGWSIAAVATIGLAFASALSGHAAVPGSALPLVADAVHILAAGGWMGGLFILLAAGLPAARALPEPQRRATMAALVNAFSPTALAFAGLVVGTGVLAAWRNVESPALLLHSPYGQVLLLKLGALAVAASIGLYNWRRARPTLATTGDDAPIRRAMRAELAAGVVVLVITAVLVAIPTPVDLVRMR
jgi:copper transport protein